MQWKSLLVFVATAECALARAHGQHKHRRHDHNLAHMERAVGGNSFYETVPVTITTTVWEDCCNAPTMPALPTQVLIETSSTETPIETPSPVETPSSVAPEPPSTPTPEPPVVEEPEPVTTSSTVPPPEPTVEPTSTAAPEPTVDWTSMPSDGNYCTDGFGGQTSHSGSGSTYKGNVGSPYGSNIIEVSAANAHKYKYVVQLSISGATDQPWTVAVWNKIGPDGLMTGWYGNAIHTFSIAQGETRYLAFDENTQGSWGAAPGGSLPLDIFGGYSCTWGEFDFGNAMNDLFSGWDVSAIQAQDAGQTVEGMRICMADGSKCSTMTPGASFVKAAYEAKDRANPSLAPATPAGPVRLTCDLNYLG